MNLFDKAICFATKAHQNQVQKSSSRPYIVHPMEVAAIVSTMTAEEEVLAAAVLHDTVEDTDVTMEDIEENFGKRVAELVACETEDKRPGIPAGESWMVRKQESLELLAKADRDMKILWLGDKLSNMRSYFRLYLLEGDDLWQHFHMTDVSKQHWYYQAIAELLSELDEYPAYQEYCKLTNIVFSTEIEKEGTQQA